MSAAIARNSAPRSPEVRAARRAAGLSVRAAAAIVRVTPRAWQHWEAGSRRMPTGLWELFALRVARRKPRGGHAQ